MDGNKDIKIGQVWKSRDTGVEVVITSKKSGNGHWNTRRVNKSGKTHKIHFGTLQKYYELIEDSK